jgi:GTP-binding protein HflX
LFATLDPTMRNVVLPSGRTIILSDTVGFISELPTSLIAAFRATLEEVLAADVILHVRDVAHEETEAQAIDVYHVLAELGLSDENHSHIIEVWNKSDLLDANGQAGMAAKSDRRADVALVSALTGQGIDHLLDLVELKLAKTSTLYEITLGAADGAGLAWAHKRGEVIDRHVYEDGRTKLTLRLDPDSAGQAAAKFGKAMKEKK